MDSIRINTGEIKLMVNDDPERVIKFNPKDIRFAEAFYRLIGENEERSEEYRKKARDIDERGGDTGEALSLLREICTDMKTSIDTVFGEGTSKAAFGDAVELDMFNQFFEGLMPYVSKSRAGMVDKYTSSGDKNVMQ